MKWCNGSCEFGHGFVATSWYATCKSACIRHFLQQTASLCRPPGCALESRGGRAIWLVLWVYSCWQLRKSGCSCGPSPTGGVTLVKKLALVSAFVGSNRRKSLTSFGAVFPGPPTMAVMSCVDVEAEESWMASYTCERESVSESRVSWNRVRYVDWMAWYSWEWREFDKLQMRLQEVRSSMHVNVTSVSRHVQLWSAVT